MGIQVYTATHGESGNALSSLERSFISFKWGDKDIQEFNLISTTTNDMFSEMSMLPQFQDLTTTQENVDGQMHWGSYYTKRDFSLTLSTDGMTTEQVNNFKNYFRPGISRKFILSQSPYLYTYARLTQVPTFTFVPFKDYIETNFNNTKIKVNTTLYKGTINLTLTSDEPFWYSTIGKLDLAGQDQLETAYEYGIPLNFTIRDNSNYIYFANNITNRQGAYNRRILANTPIYYYNCGTSSARPIVKVNLKYRFNGNFVEFLNGRNTVVASYENKEFIFSLPSHLEDYNTAIKIAAHYQQGDSYLDLNKQIRDKITNEKVKTAVAASIKILIGLGIIDEASGQISSSFFQDFSALMKSFFNKSLDLKYTFDSRIFSAQIQYTIQLPNELNVVTQMPIVENTGDSIKSKYISLGTRTSYSPNGTITANECNTLIFDTDCTLVDFNYEYTYV